MPRAYTSYNALLYFINSFNQKFYFPLIAHSITHRTDGPEAKETFYLTADSFLLVRGQVAVFICAFYISRRSTYTCSNPSFT